MNKTEDKIRILLVDDHAVVRAGYRLLLQNSEDVEIIAETSNGESACRLYAELYPDVVVMDLSLPGMSGLEAIRRIIARDHKARVLVFSMHDDMIFVDQAINAGAKGYITKNSAPHVLIDAIKEIATGKTYLEEEAAQHLAYRKLRGEDSPFSMLSTREFEIFCYLAEGLNTNEIAERLSLSYKTIANYSTQIKNKLNVNSVADLTRLAIRHGVVEA
jgi:two-component system invasion response regulator UvrY